MISSEGALQQLIETTPGILALHFTAAWSDPCKTVATALNALSQKYSGLTVHQVGSVVSTFHILKWCQHLRIKSHKSYFRLTLKGYRRTVKRTT